jgi:hypothetical protein
MRASAFFLLLFTSVSASALDREAFTFTKYDLDVHIEPEQQRLGARGKITLRNDSNTPQQNVPLQISSTLSWRSIRLDGKRVEFVSQVYNSDVDHTGALSEAIATFPQAIAPGQSVQLEIGYEGTISQDTRRLTRIGVPAAVAKHSDWDQIGREFTALRGIGYVAWYPIATEAASLSEGDAVFEEVGKWSQREARGEMSVRVFSSHILGQPPEILCSGAERSQATMENGAAQMLSAECTFTQLQSQVPTIAIGQYSVLDKPDVSIHYLDQHKSGAENYALAAEEATRFVAKFLGEHKPSIKPSVVDLPEPDATPFESGNMLLKPLMRNDTADLLAAIQQAAEASLVSSRSFIRQGIARYLQLMFFDEQKGRPAALEYLQGHRGPMLESEKLATKSSHDRDRSLVTSFDELYVQTKAMNVWWMLQDIIGPENLKSALQSYVVSSDTNAKYMQTLLEQHSHRDLAWFFDDWVYHDRGLPDFRIESVYPRRMENGGYMVTVTVENLGAAAADVPVTLHMERAEVTERLMVRGKSKASVRIQAGAMPAEVTVNDGSVPESDMSNNGFTVGNSGGNTLNFRLRSVDSQMSEVQSEICNPNSAIMIPDLWRSSWRTFNSWAPRER